MASTRTKKRSSETPPPLIPSVTAARTPHTKKPLLWLGVGVCSGLILAMWLVFALPSTIAKPAEDISLFHEIFSSVTDTFSHIFSRNRNTSNTENTAPTAQEKAIQNIESALFPDIQL